MIHLALLIAIYLAGFSSGTLYLLDSRLEFKHEIGIGSYAGSQIFEIDALGQLCLANTARAQGDTLFLIRPGKKIDRIALNKHVMLNRGDIVAHSRFGSSAGFKQQAAIYSFIESDFTDFVLSMGMLASTTNIWKIYLV